ncbi:MAG: hypothetical protein CL582_22350 [Alteromonadaceae bacterium]|nr:hypothetical protein [Alteromonadaceae bacterium]|tara:strand:- start:3742 stop:4056 length:315 start_codon:yes stop_codon:yes gene_type:complete
MEKKDENRLIKEFLRENGIGDNQDLTEEEITEAIEYKDEIVRFLNDYPRVSQYLIMAAEMANNNVTNLEILRKGFNEMVGHNQIKVEEETEDSGPKKPKKETVH